MENKKTKDSEITDFYQRRPKQCEKCNHFHTNNGKWCVICRGGVMKTGLHTNKTYRYILEKESRYAKWIAFENDDKKYNSFRKWIHADRTRSKQAFDAESESDSDSDSLGTTIAYSDPGDTPLSGSKTNDDREDEADVGDTMRDIPSVTVPVSTNSSTSTSTSASTSTKATVPSRAPAPLMRSFATFSSNPRISILGPVNDNSTMEVGKYEGRTFKWISENDQRYCTWALLLNDTITIGMKRFQEWLRSKN